MTSLLPAYRALAAEGLTMAETARRLGVCHRAVSDAAARHQISFRRGVGKPGPAIWTPERRRRQSEAMRAYWARQRGG